MAVNGWNGRKWLGTADNDWKWLELAKKAGYDQKWIELAGNGWKWQKWMEVTGNDRKWLKIDENYDYDAEYQMGWPYHSFHCVLLDLLRIFSFFVGFF